MTFGNYIHYFQLRPIINNIAYSFVTHIQIHACEYYVFISYGLKRLRDQNENHKL